MELKEILQDIVNEPYENLVNIAKSIVREVAPFFNDKSDDDKGVMILLEVLCTCMAVDGHLTHLEHRFFCDVFTNIHSTKLVECLTAFSSDKRIDEVKELLGLLPQKIKSKILTFCACIMAVDETITSREFTVIDFLCQ